MTRQTELSHGTSVIYTKSRCSLSAYATSSRCWRQFYSITT